MRIEPQVPSDRRLRVALVGCGVMGERHAKVIAADGRCELLTIDSDECRAERLAERFGARSARVIPKDIDAAVIATPTATHVPLAGPLLERDVYCLVEKPLAETAQQAASLVHERCAVGHVERFNPALRAVGPMSPHDIDACRRSPPTGRGLDIDVLLDLMIHDLDLVLKWTVPGEPIEITEAHGLGHGRLDTASAHLRSASGLDARLFASRTADRRERYLRCTERDRRTGQNRYTEIDLLTGSVVCDGQPLLATDPRDALTAQWQTFVSAVSSRARLSESASAQRAVALAQQIRARIAGDP